MSYSPNFPRTDMREFVDWLDEADMSDGWERNTRFVTDKGAYLISAQPILLNGKPVRFPLSEDGA